jgi:hypothetical protein
MNGAHPSGVRVCTMQAGKCGNGRFLGKGFGCRPVVGPIVSPGQETSGSNLTFGTLGLQQQ